MPYFCFSLKNRIDIKIYSNLINENLDNLELNKKYFSKNTNLYKILNKKCFKGSINFVRFIKRDKLFKLRSDILICLPPNIGLGDAVEYALSIKAIENSKIFNNIGVAFVGRYRGLFIKHFNFTNIYSDVVSEDDLNLYDSVFHVTLEIKDLINQKYERKDIEEVITKYFKVKKHRNKPKVNSKIIKKISIFPISQSPLRSLNPVIINSLIRNFQEKYSIELILDKSSNISNHIENKLILDNVNILYPSNFEKLFEVIKKIDFGIFIDSGPLHLAKISNVKGVLIITTVGEEVLLNDFQNIEKIRNNYESPYCSSPCGLTNIFNYKNNIGCYQTLKITKEIVLNLKNFNSLQRGSIKDNYINFIDNPVGCQKNINLKDIYKIIKVKINEHNKRNS